MTSTKHEYLFDSKSDLGAQQLALIQAHFDPMTANVLGNIGVSAGKRCLELGAGSGSIARWLADRAAPGTVIAVDKDTERMADDTGAQVLRHDITEGLPVEGPFDVIHARLFLMHFPDRAEIFARLIEQLAPGGWLVVGDYDGAELPVLSAPTAADAELFSRMVNVGHSIVCDWFGISWDWAGEVPSRMIDAGLENVHAAETRSSMTGGDPLTRLALTYNRQVQALMGKAGASETEVARFHELLADPRLRAWFYRLTYTSGQRPVL